MRLATAPCYPMHIWLARGLTGVNTTAVQRPCVGLGEESKCKGCVRPLGLEKRRHRQPQGATLPVPSSACFTLRKKAKVS